MVLPLGKIALAVQAAKAVKGILPDSVYEEMRKYVDTTDPPYRLSHRAGLRSSSAISAGLIVESFWRPNFSRHHFRCLYEEDLGWTSNCVAYSSINAARVLLSALDCLAASSPSSIAASLPFRHSCASFCDLKYADCVVKPSRRICTR